MPILNQPEITKYIKELQDIGEEVQFSHFVSDRKKFVVEKSKKMDNYKQFWSHLFGSVAKELQVQTVITNFSLRENYR